MMLGSNVPDARGQCKFRPLSPPRSVLIPDTSVAFPGITLTVNGTMLEEERQQIQG